MPDYTWVKIESWHVVRYSTPQEVATICGKFVNTIESDPLEFAAVLGAEKSCENCLRIVTRAADGDKG